MSAQGENGKQGENGMSPSAASQREEIGKNSGAASQMRAQRAIDMRSLRTKRQKQEYDTTSQVENFGGMRVQRTRWSFWWHASAASKTKWQECERSEQEGNAMSASGARQMENLVACEQGEIGLDASAASKENDKNASAVSK